MARRRFLCGGGDASVESGAFFGREAFAVESGPFSRRDGGIATGPFSHAAFYGCFRWGGLGGGIVGVGGCREWVATGGDVVRIVPILRDGVDYPFVERVEVVIVGGGGGGRKFNFDVDFVSFKV